MRDFKFESLEKLFNVILYVNFILLLDNFYPSIIPALINYQNKLKKPNPSKVEK